MSVNTNLALRSSYMKENERQRRVARSTRYPIWYPTSAVSAISCICIPKYTGYTHRFVHTSLRSSLLASSISGPQRFATKLLNSVLHITLPSIVFHRCSSPIEFGRFHANRILLLARNARPARRCARERKQIVPWFFASFDGSDRGFPKMASDRKCRHASANTEVVDRSDCRKLR